MHQFIQVDVEYRAPTAELWYIQNHTKELVHVPRAHVEYRASTPELSCETHTRTHTHTLLRKMDVEYRASTPELSFLVCFFLSEYNLACVHAMAVI
jgi:hypothetical protein